MKPWNLERALAGDPVCTREGTPVTQLHKFDVDDPEEQKSLFGVCDGVILDWYLNGRSSKKNRSDYDLRFDEPFDITRTAYER